MYKAFATIALLGLILAGCGSGQEVSDSTGLDSSPNIVLITIDCLRDDALGCYGNPRKLTPFMDRLAEEGTLFERCVAPIATTFPSHTSILTGLQPLRHGVRNNGANLSEEFTTVAEILKENGYDTAAFVGYKAMVARGGLDQGFDVVSDTFLPKMAEDDDWFAMRIRPGREVNNMAKQWLKKGAEKPFFLWVHYFEPHEPYEPTPYSDSELEDYDGPFAQGAGMDYFNDGPTMKKLIREAENLEALKTLYHGEVEQSDKLVAELMQALSALGFAEDSVVILAGDHGQGMGEHNVYSHGCNWNVALRVPLIVRDPRSPGARRVTERVGLIDLTPTILDLAGAPIPTDIQGRSLAPAIEGKNIEPRVYFSEVKSALKKDKTAAAASPEIAVFKGAHKLFYRNHARRLFDLEQDPGEDRPLRHEEHEKVLGNLEDLCEAYLASGGDFDNGAETVISEDTLKELKALGYLN